MNSDEFVEWSAEAYLKSPYRWSWPFWQFLMMENEIDQFTRDFIHREGRDFIHREGKEVPSTRHRAR